MVVTHCSLGVIPTKVQRRKKNCRQAKHMKKKRDYSSRAYLLKRLEINVDIISSHQEKRWSFLKKPKILSPGICSIYYNKGCRVGSL